MILDTDLVKSSPIVTNTAQHRPGCCISEWLSEHSNTYSNNNRVQSGHNKIGEGLSRHLNSAYIEKLPGNYGLVISSNGSGAVQLSSLMRLVMFLVSLREKATQAFMLLFNGVL